MMQKLSLTPSVYSTPELISLAPGKEIKVDMTGRSFLITELTGALAVDVSFIIGKVQQSFSAINSGITLSWTSAALLSILQGKQGSLPDDYFTGFIIRNTDPLETVTFKYIVSNGDIDDNRLTVSAIVNTYNTNTDADPVVTRTEKVQSVSTSQALTSGVNTLPVVADTRYTIYSNQSTTLGISLQSGPIGSVVGGRGIIIPPLSTVRIDYCETPMFVFISGNSLIGINNFVAI